MLCSRRSPICDYVEPGEALRYSLRTDSPTGCLVLPLLPGAPFYSLILPSFPFFLFSILSFSLLLGYLQGGNKDVVFVCDTTRSRGLLKMLATLFKPCSTCSSFRFVRSWPRPGLTEKEL